MNKKSRYVYLSLSLVIFTLIGFFYEKTFLKLIESFWFSSGILLLLTLSLIDQPFFSKDSNIFLNSITAEMSLFFLPPENMDATYWIVVGLASYLIISSYALMMIRKNPLSEENKLVQFLSKINRILGKPNVLFSILFVYGVFLQYSGSPEKLNPLLLFWGIFILFDVSGLSQQLGKMIAGKKGKSQAIGSIIGIQADNLIIVKLWSCECRADPFSFVDFVLSANNKRHQGLVIENILVEQTQIVKVLIDPKLESVILPYLNETLPKSNEVQLLDPSKINHAIDKIVGYVVEGSSISSIKFKYKSTKLINQGEILQVTVQGKTVIYQVMDAKVCIDNISQNNNSGFVIGEATQLGMWETEKRGFEKFGWVPDIYSIVSVAEIIDERPILPNELQLGYLPNTKYPVIINKEIAITHHMAILGVTGTGKSVFTRNLIREYMKDKKIKVIVIDFTDEYISKFSNPTPKYIVDSSHRDPIIQSIIKIDNEMGKFAYQRDQNLINIENSNIEKILTQDVSTFLQSSEQMSIFDLPEVENTSELTSYTRYFFKNLFKIAKDHHSFDHRVCLVLEEAHTIIPEWNFAGSSDKSSQNAINSIAQIALQGRKYDIGLLIIAQRTANVSKTILTQCNSVISFQEFDKTSIDFLSNYFGQNVAETISELPFRRAIASGKAFKATVPMMFEVPVISE